LIIFSLETKRLNHRKFDSSVMMTTIHFMIALITFASTMTTVIAIAPPHPDYLEEYKKRRKLSETATSNQTLTRISESRKRNLKLQRLSPELCHGLTEHECRRLDDSFLSYTQKARALVLSGTLRTLVLCVRFSDHMKRDLPSLNDIQALWTAGEGEATDILSTGSIREYIRQNSYNNLYLEADVFDWVTTDNTELYYSFDVSGLSGDLSSCAFPVLQALDDLGIDFSRYDLDGDGVIDSLVILHSGFPAEVGGIDCYKQRSPEQRIWSHAMGTVNNPWISSDGQYTIGGYTVASSLRGICGSDLARIGVMAHEFVHTWGIPDLYDMAGDWIGKGIGTFDIMSNPYGLDGAQTHPSNMGPWVKMQSGWLDPIEITQDGEYFVEASALNPSVYIIRDDFPNGEYLLIENRQPIGWDALLWGGGLLIWHIDDNMENNSRRGFPGQEGWPGNGNHYRVAIAGSDRNFDLEKGYNNGDDSDFWVSGSELAPGLFEFEATDYSQYPNTNSYMLGRIFPTGLRIYDISQSGTVMSFKVEGISTAPPLTSTPTPAPVPPPTLSPSRSPTRKPPEATPSPLGKPTRQPTGTPIASPSPSEDPETTVIGPQPTRPVTPAPQNPPSDNRMNFNSPTSAVSMLATMFANAVSVSCIFVLLAS
jgi:M6 family metalloprotease-like protein